MNNEEQNVDPNNSTVENPEMNMPSESRPLGPVVGIIIVVALIILGGLYFWGTQIFNREGPTAEEIGAEEDSVLNELETLGESGSIKSIEQDLGSTDFSDIDADLDNIDAELAL